MEIITVVGIIILFTGTCITSFDAIDTVKQCSMPISSGNTLYVGGSGPGNYTKIQNTIDNASDGDTVFVYNGSYYENLTVYNLKKIPVIAFFLTKRFLYSLNC